MDYLLYTQMGHTFGVSNLPVDKYVMCHQIKDSSNSKKCLSSMHQYPVKSPNLTGFPSHEAYFLVVAKKEIFIPFYSTLPLLLTLKQLDQLCTRSDIPGCTTRKIKRKTETSASLQNTPNIFSARGEGSNLAHSHALMNSI